MENTVEGIWIPLGFITITSIEIVMHSVMTAILQILFRKDDNKTDRQGVN